MPKISNVWKRRLTMGSRGAGRIILGILVVTSSISGANTVWGWVFPDPPPPIAAIADKTINASDLVKSFAIDCVTTYLTASSALGTDLARCFPNASKLTVPSTPSMIVSNPSAYARRHGPDRANLRTYGVLVGVTTQAYPSASPARLYYQIPVGVYGGDAVRALDNLAYVDEPPTGVDVELGYPANIPSTQPVAVMLAGFISAYLSNSPCIGGTSEGTETPCRPTGSLDRYITTDSGLKPVKNPYASATVTAVQAIANPPDAPQDNATLSVRVTVSARSTDYTPYDLSYPLTIRATGGSWFVAGLEAVPALADSEPQPPTANATGGK
ncbi:hypothetical protein AFM11_35110 [Mycolicibacterium wolinskyi]|uniref:Conjugal transfer protein n=1 Tax=Mycolicibacterium wolinskyi TaxID=59750 RepID=A0A132PB82_9MYCO|nr:hypothetical protein [Mycolicibacterium wolinskyi]KWX19570.1 hypothetical protein AFM11_35110 [Mycolicibacterium wolinskyi]